MDKAIPTLMDKNTFLATGTNAVIDFIMPNEFLSNGRVKKMSDNCWEEDGELFCVIVSLHNQPVDILGYDGEYIGSTTINDLCKE